MYGARIPPGTLNRPIPIKKLVVSNPSKVTSCLKSEAICENIEAILNQFIAYITLANSKLAIAE